jgi:LCP family protein required for cell wall assembly
MSQPEYHKYSCHDTRGRRLLRGLYSAFIPGTGQLVAGSRKRGYILIAVSVVLLLAAVCVVLIAVKDPDQFAAWMLEPSLLLGLLIADAALLLFRLYAVIDAIWARRTRWGIVGKPGFAKAEAGSWPPQVVGGGSASPQVANGGSTAPQGVGGGTSTTPETGEAKTSRWGVWTAALGLLVLLAFTVTPHVVLGYSYLYKSYDTLTYVFVEDTTTTTAPLLTTTTWTGASTSTSSTVSTSSTTTTAPVMVNAGEDQRLTILFLGSDAGVGRSGARSDTTIVASFDLTTGRIALFSIPRNTGNAPLSEAAQEALGMKIYSNWLTGLYGSAKRHPELAPEGGDPGAVVMRDTVSLILGIPIDYYAVVDMLGFVELVDIMGGVKIYTDKKLHLSISPPTEEEETLVYDFDPGVHQLDGRAALAFARTRHDSSDYVRMGRQRCVIAALMDQTGMTELVWNFPGIMDVIKKYMRTDIPIAALQQLVKLRSSLKTTEMITVGFNYPKYANGTNSNERQQGWIPDTKLIQATVKEILEHPEEFLAKEESKEDVDDSSCWQFEVTE